MSYTGSYFGPQSGTRWSTETLFKFSHLSSPVQKHLQQVYTTLAGALLVACVGVYVDLLYSLGGLLTSLGFLGTSIWLTATPATPKEEGKRLKLLGLAAFLQGLSIGPLVNLAIDVNPGIIATALLGTVSVFLCFSGAAIFSKRREYLYLGGVISSAVSAIMMIRFASFFFGGSASVFQLELYGGLLIFVGYILFDTQVIIERASMGDTDYIRHSLDLFVDFVAIFVRILIILLKNSGNKEEREREKKKNGRK